MTSTKTKIDKTFFKTMLAIAIPISIQNLISSSLNMIDILMIGRVSENALASVGMANQLFFFIMLISFGICSGAGIFISQYWGKKDIAKIKSTLGFAIIAVAIIGLIFSFVAIVLPKYIMMVFDAKGEVMELGVSYLRIIGISYVVTAISFAYGFSCRSVQKANMPMIVSSIALLINTGLNYLLIFGKFGFPEMGVSGAALATAIARFTELFLMILIIYRDKTHPLAANIKELMAFDKDFLKKYYVTATPVIINEMMWSLGTIMYSVAYSRVGTTAIAAVQVANTVSNIFMVASFGVGNACAVMLGSELGAGKNEIAINYAKKFAILTFMLGGFVGILLYLCIPIINTWFGVTPNLEQSVRNILLVKAFFSPFVTFNVALVIGILRSGGDTKYALFIEMGGVWLIGVPMAFIGALWLKLPIHYIVLMVSLEELFKTIVGLPRVLSNKWAKNLVDDTALA